MSISTSLNDLSKLALVASDSAYFTSAHPVLPGSALAPLDEEIPPYFPASISRRGSLSFDNSLTRQVYPPGLRQSHMKEIRRGIPRK